MLQIQFRELSIEPGVMIFGKECTIHFWIDQMEVESKQDYGVFTGYCQNLEEIQFVGEFGAIYCNLLLYTVFE